MRRSRDERDKQDKYAELDESGNRRDISMSFVEHAFEPANLQMQIVPEGQNFLRVSAAAEKVLREFSLGGGEIGFKCVVPRFEFRGAPVTLDSMKIVAGFFQQFSQKILNSN